MNTQKQIQTTIRMATIRFHYIKPRGRKEDYFFLEAVGENDAMAISALKISLEIASKKPYKSYRIDDEILIHDAFSTVYPGQPGEPRISHILFNPPNQVRFPSHLLI